MNCIQNYSGVNYNPGVRTNSHPSFKKFVTTEIGEKTLEHMISSLSQETTNVSDGYLKMYAIKFASQIDRVLPLAMKSNFFDLVLNHAGLGIKRCCEDLSKTIGINSALEAKGNKIFHIKDGRLLGAVENETVAKDLVNRVNSRDNNIEAFVDLYKALEENEQITAQKAIASLKNLLSMSEKNA